MLLPAFLFGKYADVKKRSKKILKELRSGKSFDEVLPGEMIDTNDHEGWIILEGPSRLVGGENHFNVYALMHEFYFGSTADFDKELEEKLFSKSLESPWGILLFMGDAKLKCFDEKEDRIQQYINACYQFREDIFSIGNRYNVGLFYPTYLGDFSNSLSYCLIIAGVATEKIQLARRDNGLKQVLIAYIEKR